MAGRLDVEIQHAAAAGGVPEAGDLERWIRLAFGPSRIGEVTLRIVDESESAELNERYRGRSGPTNVLSFPAGEPAGGLVEPPPLGDLVVCAPVVAREACEQHKTAAEHWAHIVVHGCLHLLGYDHVSENEAGVMETRERELLADLGIDDPYRARAG